MQRNRLLQARRRTRPLAAALLYPTALLLAIFLIFRGPSDTAQSTSASLFTAAQDGTSLIVSVRHGGYEESFCNTSTPTNFLRSTNRAWLALLLPAVVFLFCGLAVITDEYFVPALERICECLSLSDDVAGATFMAAGSSAPELFTSFLSTLGAGDDLGVGTIVGSAVFNICVIVGVSAFFAKGSRALDPRPLARDAFFYAMSVGVMLLVLLAPGSSGKATWWEGLIMVLAYGVYIAFMAFANKPYLKWTAHIAKRVQGTSATATDVETGRCCLGAACGRGGECEHDNEVSATTLSESNADLVIVPLDGKEGEATEETEVDQVEQGRLFLGVSLPTSILGWVAAPAILPWKLLFRWTVLDCKRERWRLYWPVSFIIAVLWIMALSYFMVEATRLAGCYVGVPSAVMGLTLLAAGTSVPDALASIAVARTGRADMAVSNAIGSNVFDILLGLGLPWLIAGGLGKPAKITVIPAGRVIVPIVILFFILVLLIAALVICKWQLSRTLGVIMFAAYASFVTYSLLDVFVFSAR